MEEPEDLSLYTKKPRHAQVTWRSAYPFTPSRRTRTPANWLAVVRGHFSHLVP